MAIEMVPADMRDAGATMQAAARGAGRASPHQDLDPVPGALPGSRSGPAATTLSRTWLQRFADWKRAAEGFGDDLVAEADAHEQADRRAAARLQSVAAQVPGGHESGDGSRGEHQ